MRGLIELSQFASPPLTDQTIGSPCQKCIRRLWKSQQAWHHERLVWQSPFVFETSDHDRHWLTFSIFLRGGRFGFFTGVLFFLPIFQTTWLHDLVSPQLFLKRAIMTAFGWHCQLFGRRQLRLLYWCSLFSPHISNYLIVRSRKSTIVLENNESGRKSAMSYCQNGLI